MFLMSSANLLKFIFEIVYRKLKELAVSLLKILNTKDYIFDLTEIRQ